MPKLIILKDGQETRSFSLELDVVRIGSAEGNTIRIQSSDISREHCEIRRSGTQCRLVDLESKNGTKVNGEYVNQHLLEEGDELQLGSIFLRFRRNGASGAGGRATAAPGRSRGARRGARRRAAARRAPAGPMRPPPRPRSNAMPVAMLFGVTILVLAIVLVVALMGRNDEPEISRNEAILEEITRLEQSGQYQAALDRGRRADRSGDPAVLQEIQAVMDRLQYQLEDEAAANRRKKARDTIEGLIAKARECQTDRSTMLAEIDAGLSAAAEHGRKEDLERLAKVREQVEDGRLGVGSLDDRFKRYWAAAADLRGEDRFGEAVRMLNAFVNHNWGVLSELPDREKYQGQVETKIKDLNEAGRLRWREIHDKAVWHNAQGHPKKAIRLLEQKVIGRFGLEIYETKAAQMVERFKKEL